MARPDRDRFVASWIETNASGVATDADVLGCATEVHATAAIDQAAAIEQGPPDDVITVITRRARRHNCSNGRLGLTSSEGNADVLVVGSGASAVDAAEPFEVVTDAIAVDAAAQYASGVLP